MIKTIPLRLTPDEIKEIASGKKIKLNIIIEKNNDKSKFFEDQAHEEALQEFRKKR